MDLICFNGDLLPSAQPVITIQSRGFKWGDGLFETITVQEERILLAELHFERLFLSAKMLGMDVDFLTPGALSENILTLCAKNNCLSLARVRLSVFREEDKKISYSIEAKPLMEDPKKWNGKGFRIDLYPYARKHTDAFSNLKTSSFLPYALAADFAKQQEMDDVFILNGMNRVCDTSRANIFMIKGDEVFTPALHQGCINGVMRRFLIEHLKSRRVHVRQEEISVEELENADEIFLTNAVMGIKWVGQFRSAKYRNEMTREIFEQVMKV